MPSIFLLAFWLFLLGALVISWRAGDRHDRRMIMGIVAAAMMSAAVFSLFEAEPALLLVSTIDIALLLFVFAFARTSRRFWPIWFCGFQSATVLFELAALVLPGEYMMLAWRLGAFWSMPALLSMTLGLLIDRQKMDAEEYGR